MFPLGNPTCPEQNSCADTDGVLESVWVAGSHSRGCVEPISWSKISTLPVLSTTAWIATTGQLLTEDHAPGCASVAFDTVTATADEVVTLPLVSRAIARTECGPSEAPPVFQDIEYGAMVT